MDKNIRPEISVLMPVYNGALYIKEAIDSVLSQTFTNFELVIVNDCSKDSSLEIIKSYDDSRIVVIDNEINKGLISTLNIGLKYCRGKYTARLDQDDIALPERFEKQYKYMENNIDIDVVGSFTECIDSKGKSIKITRNPTEPISIKYEFLFNNVMFHSSIFFRTDTIIKKGGYSEEFIHAEDYEMYSRPKKELKCANIPEVLFKYRIHSDSITGSVNTQPIVHMNALNVAYRNISEYIDIPRQSFDIIKDLIIIKKPNSLVSFKIVLKTLTFLKKLTNTFITKNNVSKKDRGLVIQSYVGKRNMIWQHYIIGRYHSIIKS